MTDSFSIKIYADVVVSYRARENLIIDLLRQKYGERPPDKELYYYIKEKGFHSFSTLIHNLGTHVDDFRPLNVLLQHDKSKNDFFEFLRDIKERGDACAHSIELIHDTNEISTLKPLMNKYSDLIVRLIQKIMETPHSS